MSSKFSSMDADITFLTLSYATRLLASETELDNLIKIALDTLADFGRTNKIEFLDINSDKESAKVLGLYVKGEVSTPSDEVKIDGTPLEKIIESKRPDTIITPDGKERLYMPLIGSENHVIGVVILDLDKDKPLQDLEMQILVILTTLIAMSLEHTKFYNMAMFDGLTGLFVRRQFNAKMEEEIARVNRYGGKLGYFIVDIDHFKRFNDTYGHLQGDIVLQELSGVLRDSVRKGVDVACRYGGEELVVIMPSTGIEGAFEVAERFRINCEKHEFSGQDKPLKVTVSGGVAAIDSDTGISMNEFLQRADDMLYKAKESGRNKIIAWKPSEQPDK
ncbi:MAG: sensor domain-containing diguanylate cyclase [Candidatus Hatepunaea meridiana]|nr:sensor domain-containing diguanylate cyclase [Candidatus Hatepunaea meridiana]